MTDTFFCDISYFQVPVDNNYPHPILSFRLDWGSGIDNNARANWAYCEGSTRIKVAIAYVVFKPGQAHAIFDRVKAFFGGKAPAKLTVMVDMESGSQFAGPGNHSTEANELVELFAIWLGSRKRVLGYANHYDWQSNWPAAPAWLKRFTAAYGTTDPGTFGWQYYGGVATNPSPPGYPRQCAPFGSNVDLNVIHQPIGDILAALGLASEEDPLAGITLEQIADAVWSQKLGDGKLNQTAAAWLKQGRNLADHADDAVRDVMAAIDALPDGGLTKAQVKAAAAQGVQEFFAKVGGA